MNFDQIKRTLEHIQKTCKCTQCNLKYTPEDIQIVATTRTEGLFEVKCKKCQTATIVSVIMTKENGQKEPMIENRIREHRKISENDILDIKNFLINFDGDFKKIFYE
ncbi:MAG: hypothetical protein V1679_01710 [Candidatus Peregrinibacteria bacterium]